MSRRHFNHSLERRDVAHQRRDVDFYLSLERRDAGPNVTTLVAFLSGTSRRWPERRDVALFKSKITFIFALTLLHFCLNPSAPCVAHLYTPLPESTSTPVGGHSFALRHHHRHCHHQFLPHLPAHCLCLAPSTLPVGVLASVRVRYSTLSLGCHIRLVGSHLGSQLHSVSLRFSLCTLGVCHIV